jgi:MraZ protein
VSERELFRGHALNAIDAKGRVAIPAFLRAAIEHNGDGRFLIIAKHACDPCLSGYDRGWSELLKARIDLEEDRELAAGRDFDRNNRERRAFGLVEEVPYDASGRFILPAFFRKKAGLADLAFFFGTGNIFEIWNPRLLISTPGIDEEMKEIAQFLMEERGAA